MNTTAKQKKHSVKNFLKTYRWHIFAWLLFILHESTSVAVVAGGFADPINYFSHYPVNILFFYVHACLLLPACVDRWNTNIPKAIILSILLLTAYMMVSLAVDWITEAETWVPGTIAGKISKGFVLSTLWRGFYFMSFATTFFYVKQFVVQQRISLGLEKKEVERELREKKMAMELSSAKNAHIRAQVSPHFLFNTLTYVYDQALGKEPKAGKAILYLSKLMRYAIESDHGPETVPLKPEIQQVENLIELSKIKQPEIYIEFSYANESMEVSIIPLILIGLAENMIKHGNMSIKEDPGRISIALKEEILIIKTDNLKNTGINDTGFHTGLNNIQTRLSFSYGTAARLDYYVDKRDHFIAAVEIPIAIDPGSR
ncbi:MAG: histidine kinase [Chitinophagaceae bacterium]|nr:MAG: histidine kinase [Chitinophagaceae bacterium]